MKTEAFKKTISDHLEQRANDDPLFRETMQKANKNIDDCVKYIINQVKKTGDNVFADAEIFGMAVHYYDEDNIETGPAISGLKSVSHSKEKKTTEKPAKQKAANVLDEIQPHLF